jgi:repressor LexA
MLYFFLTVHISSTKHIFIMKTLTDRQRKILEFIRQFAESKNFWPSIRDIQLEFNFRSTNAVIGHLRALEKKAAIERIPGQARTFQLASQLNDAAENDVDWLPVHGNIAAGYPDRVESSGAIHQLRVDSQTAIKARAQNGFCLKVSGESMRDAGIFDGDHVVAVVRPPRDGDIVVALIDGESTLKRYVKKNNAPPYLKAENSDYPALYPINELTVQGVAFSIVRAL